jgi:hypothetical protein
MSRDVGLVEDEVPGSSRESLVDTLAGIQSLVEGRSGMSIVLNTGIVLLCQAMTSLLAIFFLAVDSAFSTLVHFLLGLIG